MMPSWFRQSYLFWALQRDEAHCSDVTHSSYTRLYKCHTQSVQLNKHSKRRKKSCMYLRNIDDNPHQQCVMWFFLSWAAGSSSLTLLLFSSFRWQWEHHCCIQNSEQCDHVTCSYCNTHWNVLMYNDIWKECHTVCLTVDTTQKSTHSDSESELHWCTTADEFSSDSVWYKAVQTEHSHWAAQEWLLSEKSEHTEWAAADQQRELNQHQQLQEENNNVHIVENEGSVSCQLQTHTCMTLTLLLLLLMLLLLSLLYKSQCWHIQSRKVSHTKVVSEEVEEERKEVYMRWGFITHFTDDKLKWIVKNHASNEKFSSANCYGRP
jgi:hypothetical protein